MSVAWILVILLGLLCMALGIHAIRVDSAMKNMARDLRARIDADTNTLIDVDICDHAVRALAASLNKDLRILSEQRLRYERGDLELRNAVTNIAHDIRTPLTAIMGYVDLIEDSGKLNVQYLALVRDRCLAIKAFTDELMSYSISLSMTQLKPEQINLGSFLQDSMLSYYGAMKKRGIEPVISLSDKPVVRMLDKDALSRILSNLVSNVLKYSDGDLRVSLDENGLLRFINSAKCLDEVNVGKLFDRFFTVQNAQSSTGLGLSIAKSLTQRMGGTIEASLVGQELCISLFFPEK